MLQRYHNNIILQYIRLVPLTQMNNKKMKIPSIPKNIFTFQGIRDENAYLGTNERRCITKMSFILHIRERHIDSNNKTNIYEQKTKLCST